MIKFSALLVILSFLLFSGCSDERKIEKEALAKIQESAEAEGKATIQKLDEKITDLEKEIETLKQEIAEQEKKSK